MLRRSCGRKGEGESRRSSRVLRRSISVPINSISSRSSSSRPAARRASNWAAPLSPASGLRSSWAKPFSAALNALGNAWVGSKAGNSSTGWVSSSQPPSSSRDSQPSAKRGASLGRPRASRCSRRMSRSSLSRKRASASPCTSNAASGWSTNRRALTPSQRANAGLTPSTRPSRSAQATGVPRLSREGVDDDISIAPI